MKNIIGIIAVLGLSWLTWTLWFPSETITHQADVRSWLPDRPDMGAKEKERWRVFTRRMVWDKAVESFQGRLKERNIEALLLERKESVLLHVFDDPREFPSRTEAQKAKVDWDIEEVDIIRKDNGMYMLGLGRFYIIAYAEQRQERLKKTGHRYVYEQQKKEIPTYRFIFPPLPEAEAELLWKSIQELGAVDPVMMSENEFNAMFVGNIQ